MTSNRVLAGEEYFKPAFVVGVTGHIDLDPAYRDRIKEEVKRVFEWLGASPKKFDRNSDDIDLGPGLGLKNTPIILLSSLAPGADQWVVEAALELEPRPRVLAPLPFLKDQYLQVSTFRLEGVVKDEAASKFLAEFPDENVFVVRLPDEIDLDDTALRAKHQLFLTGKSGKAERDRRYAAAGQYVAAYSDILIAVTDKPIGQAESAISRPIKSEGARAIAELKRRGFTPGLVPVLPALTWADNGPVIHIFAPRKGTEANTGAENSVRREGKHLEILYPYNHRPLGVRVIEEDNPAWLKAGHAILKIASEHLDRLNSEKIRVDLTSEAEAFAELLPAAANPIDPVARKLRQHALPAASEQLKQTLDRLARLRRRIANFSAHYNTHLARLKIALFSLAFCSAVSFALADNWNVAGSPLPPVLFLIGLALTITAWIVYLRFKKTAAAERSDDYRAIAEGLRAQFYWTACGSGEAVASNYLQHQGGELGWIRNVINVAAFPHELNRVAFNRLTFKDQCAALQSIREAWIGGQWTYYKKSISDLSRRRDIFSTYAHVLLVTGFALFAFFFFFAQGPDAPVLPRSYGFLFLAAGSLLFAAFAGRIQSYKGRHHLVVDTLLSAALIMLIIGTIYLVAGIAPWLPSAYKLGSVAKYLALAGGVLCGAWVEVNFFSENIRRYASMASLFEAAGVRFDEYFSWLQRASKDQIETVRKQVVTNIQSLIVAVGREALSENAEWLIAHRARPIEPVSV
jgi:hypothetical protein